MLLGDGTSRQLRLVVNDSESWFIMQDLAEKIKKLKEEKNAVILAHYYVEDEVQQIADYVGDSYYLSKVATELDAEVLVLCGVSFMGESAKILNTDKKVLMPDETADCPMAHMVDMDRLKSIHDEIEDVAVVCYINSTAEIKQYADVIVTSANALSIVKKLPNKNIFFIPDKNLGRFIASKVPEKNFYFNEGWCPIHNQIAKADIVKAKEAHKEAEVLVHPECQPEVLELADYIGSTTGIIKYASESPSNEFIIVTEKGVFYELCQKNPDKKFYPLFTDMICEDMKKIALEKVCQVLEEEAPQVQMESALIDGARLPLEKMLELAD